MSKEMKLVSVIAVVRIQGLDEGQRGGGRCDVAELGLEIEDPRLAHVVGPDGPLLVGIGLDDVAGRRGPHVVVVAEDDELLEALVVAALALTIRQNAEPSLGAEKGPYAADEGDSVGSKTLP